MKDLLFNFFILFLCFLDYSVSSVLHAGFLWMRRAALRFIMVGGLLIVAASLIAEHRLQAHGLQ